MDIWRELEGISWGGVNRERTGGMLRAGQRERGAQFGGEALRRGKRERGGVEREGERQRKEEGESDGR